MSKSILGTLALIELLTLGCSSTSEPPLDDDIPPAEVEDLWLNPEANLPPIDAELSRYIVVDQFGYLPNSTSKVAVVRDPEQGHDASESFVPGAEYAVVNAENGEQVFNGSLASWRSGAVDSSSGDRVWHFDFSALSDEGIYYVLDAERNARSATFRIASNVYEVVLKHAVRSFFYQRAGFAKEAKYAGEGWADGASHVGPLQDKNARLYSAPGDASTERDLSGGWYDAGDYNKYTNWHSNYVVSLLQAYSQNPDAFGDDLEIPESGNGIPDILDETKWGMQWLERMQNPDGAVLSIVDLAHASPPSAADEPSLYGRASTSATLSAAAAFAYGFTVFKGYESELGEYSNGLLQRAEAAFSWADANPSVRFQNNDAGSGTQGIGAGRQEVDDYGRLMKKLQAAIYLFEATGNSKYRDFVDGNFNQAHLLQWSFAYPYEPTTQEMLLHYANLEQATPAVAESIKSAYRSSMIEGEDNLVAARARVDPYLAYLDSYVWGSNGIKSWQGSMFLHLITFAVEPSLAQEAAAIAEHYVHYLHGVNPQGMVYLSNMYPVGAERSANEFYHSWFTHGSARWDRVGQSEFGPPPGFLVGGPNSDYSVDSCCPNSCGSVENNALCTEESLSPPAGQPDQKSYKDFNTAWPANSWAVTENSNGYQAAYIGLLSKFVK